MFGIDDSTIEDLGVRRLPPGVAGDLFELADQYDAEVFEHVLRDQGYAVVRHVSKVAVDKRVAEEDLETAASITFKKGWKLARSRGVDA